MQVNNKRKVEQRLNNRNVELKSKLKNISKQTFNRSFSNCFAAKF